MSFIGGSPVCLILEDNIFFGTGLPDQLRRAAALERGALVLAYPVRDPERYGVIEFDSAFKAISIDEKPLHPRSNFAIPGLYFYDNRVVPFTESLNPSPRGELEITDLARLYLKLGEPTVMPIGRGVA